MLRWESFNEKLLQSRPLMMVKRLNPSVIFLAIKATIPFWMHYRHATSSLFRVFSELYDVTRNGSIGYGTLCFGRILATKIGLHICNLGIHFVIGILWPDVK